MASSQLQKNIISQFDVNISESSLMGKLNDGLSILSTMNVYDLDKHLIEFEL
jgi:hypothetical protein